MILIADSGSTKTDWAVVGGAPVVVHTQGINPVHQSEEAIAQIIQAELLPQIDPRQVSNIYFYGSGLRAELQSVMTSILKTSFPLASVVEPRGDLLGAARALCGRSEGIACILGTGANSCLYDGETIVQNTPPLGYILGDEGSGAVLGIRFLNALLKGFLPASLREAYLDETRQTEADIINRVYRQPLANRYLASASRFIGAHQDSPALRQLVVVNFRQFFQRNLVQYARRDLPVACVGSVAWFYRDQLAEAAAAEGYRLGTVLRSPIEGLMAYHSASL